MSTYLWFNLFIIAFPLAFSFGPWVKYYTKYKALFSSIIIVSILFVLWDLIAVYRGDWSFNSRYIIGLKVFGLPMKKILFFITVPYSCVFIYESLLYFGKDRKIPYNKYFYIFLGLLLICISLIFRHQYYTFTVLNLCALFIFITVFFLPSLFQSELYWEYIILSFIPFLIFNFLLTSYPVVVYNPNAIWGIRIITIPLEDFFYNYTLLSFYLFFYKLFKSY